MTDEALKAYLEKVAIKILQVPELVTVEAALFELQVAVDYLEKHLTYPHQKPVLNVVKGGKHHGK